MTGPDTDLARKFYRFAADPTFVAPPGNQPDRAGGRDQLLHAVVGVTRFLDMADQIHGVALRLGSP